MGNQLDLSAVDAAGLVHAVEANLDAGAVVVAEVLRNTAEGGGWALISSNRPC
ncbi:hypothetical protein [Variovorax sp. LjRoot178]|uniref:hypothetical protein n=1 Tax=Variovorax sp. LjRoot178 TaxID=3342277 RepID=UPI003F514BBB